MHNVTCKLNKDARVHPTEKGTVFFVSLGEKHYNRSTKQSGFTNYEAALFANSNQVQYYTDNLKQGAIVSVSGESIIADHDDQYGTRLSLQNSRLAYVFNPATHMPDSVRQQGYQNQPNPTCQQAAQQPNQAPEPMNDFDSSDIPF